MTSGRETRPDLQGVRALAVVAVMLAHAGFEFVSGGFVGVDMFFVLSGYLITARLCQDLETPGQWSLQAFYARRMQRLLPALLLVIVVTLVFAPLLLGQSQALAQLGSTELALTYTSNLYFAFREVDYFDELAELDLFLHTWSLGVEEQFYLFWPLVLLFLFRTGATKGPSGTPGNAWQRLGKGLFAMLLFGLGFSLYLTSQSTYQGFYLMPSRIWQFALGGCVFLLSCRRPSSMPFLCISARVSVALGWAGLALLIGSVLLLHSRLVYPGLWALLPSLGTALVIWGGSSHPLALLSHPVFVWVGDRSYSLYLWHWPALIFLKSSGREDDLMLVFAVLLLVIALAALSYKYVELPFWKGRWRSRDAKRTLCFTLLVMLLTLCGAGYYRSAFLTVDAQASPSHAWRHDLPQIYAQGCDQRHHSDAVMPCMAGPDDASHRVLIMGDSIALQWYSMVPEIFAAPQWKTLVLTKSSCPMIDKDMFYKKIGKTFEVCSRWRNRILADFERFRADVVIIGSASYDDDPYETDWVDGSARVLEKVAAAAKVVLLVPGTPSLTFDGPGCLEKSLETHGAIMRSDCVSKDRMGYVNRISDYLRQAASRFANVHLLDLNSLVCPGADCYAYSEDGQVVFRDSQHLTDTFVRSRTTAIAEKIKSLLLQNDAPEVASLATALKVTGVTSSPKSESE